VGKFGVGKSTSGYSLVVACCKNCNELAGSIKGEELLE
jgi:hypothetical protein